MTSDSKSDTASEPRTVDAVIHDLKNALGPAVLRIDLLLAANPEEKQRLEYLHAIQASLARAKDLISKLEDLVASRK